MNSLFSRIGEQYFTGTDPPPMKLAYKMVIASSFVKSPWYLLQILGMSSIGSERNLIWGSNFVIDSRTVELPCCACAHVITASINCSSSDMLRLGHWTIVSIVLAEHLFQISLVINAWACGAIHCNQTTEKLFDILLKTNIGMYKKNDLMEYSLNFIFRLYDI